MKAFLIDGLLKKDEEVYIFLMEKYSKLLWQQAWKILNGIATVTVLSAFSDGMNLRLLLELEDLEGQRLSNGTNFYNRSTGSGYFNNVSSYSEVNEENKITMVVTSTYPQEISIGDEINISLETILSDFEYVDSTDTGMDLYEILKDKPEIDMLTFDEWKDAIRSTGVEVSEFPFAGQMPVTDVESLSFLKLSESEHRIDSIDWAVISNIGFKDGRLNIQIKHTDKYNFTYNYGRISLTDPDGNEIVPLFDSNQGDYTEKIYEIGEIENLKNVKLKFWSICAKTVIDGNWNLRFTVTEQAEKKTINAATNVSPYFNSLEISVSPMKTYVGLKSDSPDYFENFAEISQFINCTESPYIKLNDGNTAGLFMTGILGIDGVITIECESDYFDISKLESIVIFGEEHLY